MTIGEYKRRVRDYLESGKATDEQWATVLAVILHASEDGLVDLLDRGVFSEEEEEIKKWWGSEND